MGKLLIGMALVALGATGLARADTLLIEGLTEPGAAERPVRGMTMDRVSAGWGQPERTQGPVGEPPITRWEYPGFVVFFEHRHVIHSVTRR
ncbi:MAG: hypothetical protein JJT85_12635 [Chromatiales bacterium]|nr:hypothetical protein [Chromatiales bacterium]